jgi:hypothetical protein
MADKKVRIKMTASLFGEDKKDWLKGEIHEASEGYATYLIGRDAAVLAQPTDKSEAVPHGPRPTGLTTASVTTSDPTATTRDPGKAKP